MADVPLLPCLLCRATEFLTVQAAPDPFFGTTTIGAFVSCTACGLRAPWRLTEAKARAEWNRHIACQEETGTTSETPKE